MIKKQKICIIGGSLTGLVTAISLSRLNCKIDLIMSSNKHSFESNRTTAISQNNFNFLKELNIPFRVKKDLWPCSAIKLYTENKTKEFLKIFEFETQKKEKEILYMAENINLIKLMINKIKKIRSIKVIKNKKISEIKNSGLLKSIKLNNIETKYNLIILCTGSNSDLVKNIFKDKMIKNFYNETSTTAILKHKFLNNNIARQIFLDDKILAMLPISNTRTSIVLSKKENNKNKDFNFKKKIRTYAKDYLENIKFETNAETRNLNFLIRRKYYKDRILLFGDALHVIHPFVGQGFNMILRDLLYLKKVLEKKINLGLDIGSTDVLSEFTNQTKPSNFIFSYGTDILRNSFSIKNVYIKKIRNDTLKNLNKSNFAKNIFLNIADKGFKF